MYSCILGIDDGILVISFRSARSTCVQMVNFLGSRNVIDVLRFL
jgi:hypothetical protein